MRIIFVLFIGLTLGACQHKQHSSATHNTNKYSVAGTNQTAVTGFLAQLKTAAKKNSASMFSKLISFPLRVNVHHRTVFVSKRRFNKQYKQIFTATLKKIILASDAGTLFVNSQGVMLGNGQIWVRPSGKAQSLKIFVINQ